MLQRFLKNGKERENTAEKDADPYNDRINLIQRRQAFQNYDSGSLLQDRDGKTRQRSSPDQNRKDAEEGYCFLRKIHQTAKQKQRKNQQGPGVFRHEQQWHMAKCAGNQTAERESNKCN